MVSDASGTQARRRWRQAARNDDATTRQRNLADLLGYLEREGIVDPNDPITTSDAHVIHRAQPLLEAIARLRVSMDAEEGLALGVRRVAG
jgi:hypothetical protein